MELATDEGGIPRALGRRRGSREEQADLRGHGSPRAHAAEVRTTGSPRAIQQTDENRGMVEPIFQKPHVEMLKPYIQKTVDNLLNSMVEGGCSKPVDLVEKFSLPVPSYVRYSKVDI